jgi:hypothetical protein
VLAIAVAGGCFSPTLLVLRPELRAAAARQDALALADGLEALIDDGTDTPHDREAAYDTVRQWPQRTAEYAYARAQIAGRLAQTKGLAGAHLVREMERWTRYSLELDARFRRGAAKRMLGSLYVLAPAALLDHGDSEAGLALLEETVRDYPGDAENHLRLAEAFVALDDPDPARPHLCFCLGARPSLRADHRRLLDKLVESVGGPRAVACGGRG